MRKIFVFSTITSLSVLLMLFQNCAKGTNLELAEENGANILNANKSADQAAADAVAAGAAVAADANSEKKSYILRSYVNASGAAESKSIFVYAVTASVDPASGKERFTISEPAKDCNNFAAVCSQYLENIYSCSEISSDMACVISVNGKDTVWKYDVSSFYYLPKTAKVELNGSFLKISDTSSKSYAILEEVTNSTDLSMVQFPSSKLVQVSTSTQMYYQTAGAWTAVSDSSL